MAQPPQLGPQIPTQPRVPEHEQPLVERNGIAAENLVFGLVGLGVTFGPGYLARQLVRAAAVLIPLSAEEFLGFNAVKKIHGVEEKLEIIHDKVTGQPRAIPVEAPPIPPTAPTLGSRFLEDALTPLPDLVPSVRGVIDTVFGGDNSEEVARILARRAAVEQQPRKTTLEALSDQQLAGLIERVQAKPELTDAQRATLAQAQKLLASRKASQALIHAAKGALTGIIEWPMDKRDP